MYELIYCGDDSSDYVTLQAAIKKRFPQMIIEDATDDIHGYRIVARSDDVEMDDFIVFAIQEGFALCCLGINLLLGTEMDRIKALIDKAKTGMVAV